jgi:hypothetical protein
MRSADDDAAAVAAKVAADFAQTRVAFAFVALLATVSMLGQLSVDMIFDTSSAATIEDFRAYYCTLLQSFEYMPEVFRVGFPCLALALGLTLSALSELSDKFSQAGAVAGTCGRSLHHVFAGLVLCVAGLPCFYFSVAVAETACFEENDNGESTEWLESKRHEMARWHVCIFLVLATSLALQTVGVWGFVGDLARCGGFNRPPKVPEKPKAE